MSRPEGSPKTGGRKKGTPNRKTLGLQEALEANELDIVEQLAKLLPQLSEDKRADVLIDLMSYQYPKRKAIEVVPVKALEVEKPIAIRLVAAKDGKSAREENQKILLYQGSTWVQKEPET